MFRIINGGSFSRHQEGFFMKRSAGLPYYVFLLIRSVSEIQIDTAKFYAKPDSILFIKPNIPYSYHNPEGEYIDDWLHFDCDVGDIDFFPDEMWNASFSCSNSSLLGNYIEQLLWEKNFAPEELRAETTDLLFTILVKYCIFEFNNRQMIFYSPYLYTLQRQRIAMQSAPYKNYNAKDFAIKTGISLSHYEHLYRQFFF